MTDKPINLDDIIVSRATMPEPLPELIVPDGWTHRSNYITSLVEVAGINPQSAAYQYIYGFAAQIKGTLRFYVYPDSISVWTYTQHVWVGSSIMRDDRICSQCGNPYTESACGPTHALIARERKPKDPSMNCNECTGRSKAHPPCNDCRERVRLELLDELEATKAKLQQAESLPASGFSGEAIHELAEVLYDDNEPWGTDEKIIRDATRELQRLRKDKP